MPSRHRSLSRRRRRLYWTAGLLLAAGSLGTWIGWTLLEAARPETYRPGEEHEEITSRLDRGVPPEAPAARFVDVAREAGLGEFRAFAGERSSQLPEDMGPGAAWGDYDGDGDDDLFLVAAGGPLQAAEKDRARSRLYENRGGGTFREAPGFPETRILGMAAAWGDYDRDGRPDLVVTGHDALRLYRNLGGGSFVRDAALRETEGFWAGASWADFDRDGDLDLYICGYVRYETDSTTTTSATRQYGRAVPYTLNPSSFPPERNLLFRNDGNGGFEEVAETLGVSNPEGRSLAALWHDLDGNGWPDLYVANDISDNALFLNSGGAFRDVSHAAWVADYRGAMGLAVGDWNRDGDDDLFVSHWMAQENALYDSIAGPSAAGSDGGAAAPVRFMDIADQRGLGQIALQKVGWGVEFLDFDSDGWLDLAVANGSTLEADGAIKRLEPQASFLFWNHRGSFFHDLAPLGEALSAAHVSRGLAVADYDSDGDLDLLIVDRDAGVRLLRNDTPQGNRVQVRLEPRAREEDAAGGVREGAVLVARVGAVELRRSVSGASYLSQSSATVHFGLGDAPGIDRLEVRWPSGTVDVHENLGANAIWLLHEGRTEPVRVGQFAVLPAGREGESEDRRVIEFWRTQRAAMHAMKVEEDLEKAIDLFRRALDLDPTHEDSLYYLGNCLAETGDVDGALRRFDELRRLNRMSHRAHKRWGTLRAMTARTPAELAEAEEALERAVSINPEATGALLVLGELDLRRGAFDGSRRRLEWVGRTNPGSVESHYLLGYIAWKEGHPEEAREWLVRARRARGDDRTPEGATAEGDVRRRMHTDVTLLAPALRAWDGTTDPNEAYAALEVLLDRDGALAR